MVGSYYSGIQNSDAHEASLHHQMDENGKDLFSGQ